MKRLLMITTALLLSGSSVAQSAPQSLTLYSGRGKTFVEPLVRQFERASGIKVTVRYGSDAELVAALREEGKRSPADVYWGNSVGALGSLAAEGKFRTLPAGLFKQVAPAYAPENRAWLPTTLRFRSLAYHTERVKLESLPASIMDLPKMTSLKGRIGWTLSYSSFQDFLAGMLVTEGEAKTRAWLEGMKALAPRDFAASNVGMLEAMRGGQIDVALTNHYYIQRLQRAGAPIDTYFFKPGDIGNLGSATGAAILKTSQKSGPAQRLLAALVGKEAQTFFLGVNFEYPVVGNIIYPTTLKAYEDMTRLSPRVAPEALPGNAEKVQKLLRDVGLL